MGMAHRRKAMIHRPPLLEAAPAIALSPATPEYTAVKVARTRSKLKRVSRGAESPKLGSQDRPETKEKRRTDGRRNLREARR